MRRVLIDHRRHAFAAATLVAAVLVVLFAWAVLRTPGGAGAAPNRLNLVVILADDQRWTATRG